MKLGINNICKPLTVALICLGLSSCNDYLDREPLSKVSPDKYLTAESDLATYSINQYAFRTPEDWTMVTGDDNNTDSQAAVAPDNRFSPGDLRVAQKSGDEDWEFSKIYKCNYFLDAVLPRWKSNGIKGDEANISHYIGEIYFLRAYAYYEKLKKYGDYPIIREVLPDDKDVLIKASKRMPRNEVARFILADLDSAAMLMKDVAPNGKNRLSKNVAYLFKSRVALFEASWLKNFKNTPLVPNGTGWPGKEKEYNASYQYPSGSIDEEINYFLDVAIESSDKIAGSISLTENSKNADELDKDIKNPYYMMFCDKSLEKYQDVLFWRVYDPILVSHVTTRWLTYGSCNSGYTKGLVDAFVMENGLPIYAQGSGYKGDEDFTSFREGRDWRLRLFTKTKGDFLNPTSGNFDYPKILSITEEKDVTGYSIRKYCDHNFYSGAYVDTGWPIFMASEAYLNYMEAYYLRYGQIGGNVDKYWKAIRTRAGIDPDYTKTIAATDMNMEAKGDWGVYTAGQLVDPIMYNIRRERRCELIAEGFRYDDLRRWRSMDQMITKPYIIEGFNLWADNYKTYVNEKGESLLISEGAKANVSPASQSTYLRPYQIVKDNNRFYDGYKWHPAHYLSPIPMDNFIITSNGDMNTSPIYQNPGWPKEAQKGPESVSGF